MTPDEQCLHDLKAIYNAHKAASDNPSWVVTERNNRRRIAIACPLWINEAVVAGLRLEIDAFESRPAHRPFMLMSSKLLASLRGKTWHLSRVDFDPEPTTISHRNPPNRWNAPPIINGGHWHPFVENASLGLEALSQAENLPLALPLNRELATFDDILKVIRDCFIVPELWIEEPPWSQMLPF